MTKNLTIEQRASLLLALAQKNILSFSEAVIYLGIPESTLYKLTHRRRIKYSKPSGKKIFFLREDLDAYALGNPQRTFDEIDTEAATRVTLSA